MTEEPNRKWCDPLKLAGFALMVLIPLEMVVRTYWASAVADYLKLVNFCMTILVVVLATMRLRRKL